MVFRLSPRKRTSLTTQFTEIAQLVLSAAGELAHLLAADAADRPKLTVSITDAEHDTFEASRRIQRLLRSALVTPYDRHDLTDLAQQFGQVADRIEEAADLANRYRVGRLPDPLLQQVQILERSCEVLANGITHLRVVDSMQDMVIELHRLANHADVLNRQAKVQLLRGDHDIREVIAALDVARAVTEGTNAVRHVAGIVERIRVKEV